MKISPLHLILPRGTPVLTRKGLVPVEAVKSDATLVTHDGHEVTVLSIDNLADQSRTADTSVVAIQQGALAEGVPAAMLKLACATMIRLGGVVMEASELANSASIVVSLANPATLYRINLAGSGIFDIGGVTVVVDNIAPSSEEGGRKTQMSAIRRHILNRMQANGWQSVEDRRIQVAADGAIVAPLSVSPSHIRFTFARPTTNFRIYSASAVVRDWAPESGDTRKLGVQVAVVKADGQDVPLDAPCFGAGFYALETCGPRPFRWTDGNAALTLPCPTAVLEIELEQVVTPFEPVATQPL